MKIRIFHPDAAGCVTGYPVAQPESGYATGQVTQPEGPQLPKILYKIVQSFKFGEDCKIVKKIVTLPKQLLYFTRDVTCDHVICRPSRTLTHGNLLKNSRKFIEKWYL